MLCLREYEIPCNIIYHACIFIFTTKNNQLRKLEKLNLFGFMIQTEI
jgi:hypothetical protein